MKLIRLGLVAVLLPWALSLGEGSEGTSQPRPPIAPEDFSKTWRVCPEGPPTCDFATISEAIQVAKSNDFLRIDPGVYQENLLINKDLQITATESRKARIQGVRPGWPTIILQSQGELQVALDGVVILGGPTAQTVRDCFNENLCYPYGVALQGEGSIFLVLSNSEIAHTTAGVLCPRGLLSLGKAKLILLNSRLSNSAYGLRLDICQFREISLQLDQVDIAGNSVGVSLNRIGALREEPDRATIEIESSRFIGNDTGLEAYFLKNSQVAIRNTWFVNNLSFGARILDFPQSGRAEIRASRFIGSFWGLQVGSGPAAWDEGGYILVEDSVITDNTERGIYTHNQGRTELRNNLIQDNGMGVLVAHAEKGLWLKNNRILRNREWGVALVRSPCVENPPQSPAFIFPIIIQGQDNEIRDNGKGNLCPEDYNWPADFIKNP
jgi:parallel beta-helix repeat protein